MKFIFATIAAVVLSVPVGMFATGAEAAPPCSVPGSTFRYLGGPNHITTESANFEPDARVDVTARFVASIVKFNAELIKEYLAIGDLSYSQRGMSHDPNARTDFIISHVLREIGCR